MLERLIPYKIMRRDRIVESLGDIPQSAISITRKYLLIANKDADRVYDKRNLLSAFVREALKEAERARHRTAYYFAQQTNQ